MRVFYEFYSLPYQGKKLKKTFFGHFTSFNFLVKIDTIQQAFNEMKLFWSNHFEIESSSTAPHRCLLHFRRVSAKNFEWKHFACLKTMKTKKNYFFEKSIFGGEQAFGQLK